jgi:transcriptional regulator with XRE-family HTH domain
MSDDALIEQIGSFVKQSRLEQNITQQDLAREAGISRSTLSLLERGESFTINTLIQVLRILEQLHFMDFFRKEEKLSPVELAKLKKKERQRSRNQPKAAEDSGKLDW